VTIVPLFDAFLDGLNQTFSRIFSRKKKEGECSREVHERFRFWRVGFGTVDDRNQKEELRDRIYGAAKVSQKDRNFFSQIEFSFDKIFLRLVSRVK